MKKFSGYLNSTNFFILVLIIILIASIVFSPSMGIVSPYKEVNGTYIENPVFGEQVQFDGKYVARTNNYGNGDVLYSSLPIEYDVIDVDGQYVFLSDEYWNSTLVGNIGKTVHVEGAFENVMITTQKVDGKDVDGHIFKADKIELL